MITTQVQLRNAFWATHPEFERKGHTDQNDYPANVRIAWCDFVDAMCRDGEITEALAWRATL